MLFHKLPSQLDLPMWCLHEIEALYHRAQIALLEHCNSRTKVAIGGHICLMLCKKNCQFMELNAFSASASKTASVLFSKYVMH